MVWENGDRYVGDWLDDAREGYGKMESTEGWVYYG